MANEPTQTRAAAIEDTAGQWLPLDTAPTDGTEILGLVYGEPTPMRWTEQPVCMLAGVAPGAGLFDEGWEDVLNGLVIWDGIEGWRPLPVNAREQRLCATPIEVINADETTGTIRIVVVGWSIAETIAVPLAQFSTATGLGAEELVAAQWLEADVNIHAVRAEDLQFQGIVVAPPLPPGFMGTPVAIDTDEEQNP